MVDGNAAEYLGFIALTFIASSSTSMKIGSWKHYNVNILGVEYFTTIDGQPYHKHGN